MDTETSFIQLLALIEKCMITPFQVTTEDNENIVTNMEQLLEAENIKLFGFLNERSDNAYAAKLIGNFYNIKYEEDKSDIGSRTEAYKWYGKSAEMGQPFAMINIGLNHMNGDSVEQNYELAMEFFKKAVEKKHADGMFHVGEMYYYGYGVPKSLPHAFNWYMDAAKLGDIDGIYSVAYMYLNGEGVDKSYTECLKWYHQAAIIGNPHSMCYIADLYNGDYPDFTPDKKVAMEWYLKAANLGSVDAMRIIADSYYEKDQKEALEWYKKITNIEADDTIMYFIGQMYELGQGCTSNLSESLLWYGRAAALNNVSAMNKIAAYYYYGRAVPCDYNAAFSWYMKAAQLKSAVGIANVGNMYYQGLGCIQDKKKGIKWLQKSLEKKCAESSIHLGRYYKNAYTQTDKTASEKIIQIYEKGAELGCTKAMLELGDLYQKGVYTEKDEKLALKWYHEAVNNKNYTALTKIGEIYEDQKNIDQAIKYFTRSLQKITDKVEAEGMKKKITKLMKTNNIDLLTEWIKLVDEKAEKAHKIPEPEPEKPKSEVLHPDGDGYILC
ncbi:MAG: hypothetical protein Hyperionvirus4_4 [Hyperionvirus sp.]|uniref:Uncharacterized protein n=1 Tax=Hyperionvirus sp. TaxID=2487770 RepID=A0A3G5ACH0_9VIRU|nr:MAG: hypothetical protein Hyperionvirus4_4 [Hyperionvirus sp.]